jgi:glycerate 2-kinase
LSLSDSLGKILFAGIDAVRPAALFPKLFVAPPYPELRKWLATEPRFLLSIGKAGLSSAKAILPIAACTGHFVLGPGPSSVSSLNLHIGSHPIPDYQSLNAARELRSWLKNIPSKSNLLIVLSGGASALMVAPAHGISLQSKKEVNDLLIRSGASIQEINAVRKHISEIKGGQLAKAAAHLNCLVLVISDVISDDLATIGSGPFYPDDTTFVAACDVLRKYDLWNRVPADVRSALEQGAKGNIAETPKPGSGKEFPHYIIASNDIARRAAAEKARKLGQRTDDSIPPLSGPVEAAVAKTLSLLHAAPGHSAIILGGEVTVRVQGSGTGGRNQHFCLLMTEQIAGTNILFAAVGTDGIDGNSNAAGAWTDGGTQKLAIARGLNLQESVSHFDSYPFFHALGQDITTGPTGTNVMDLYIALKAQ